MQNENIVFRLIELYSRDSLGPCPYWEIGYPGVGYTPSWKDYLLQKDYNPYKDYHSYKDYPLEGLPPPPENYYPPQKDYP